MPRLNAASRHRVGFTLNGKPVSLEAEPRLLATDALRHGLGATGTHVGCEHGICGVCTVLIDGRSARSCLALAVQADGCDVTTVEGLRDGATAQLHPIQQAFVEAHGLQCGFCTPGFMMTTLELLTENADPSDDEIKEALGGNLCRCTGYESIIASVRLAARRLREQQGA